MNKPLLTILAGVLAAAMTTQAIAESNKPYLLGVFPFLSQSQLEPIYSSLTGELGKALNKPFFYSSARDMRSFIDDIEDAKFDVMFTQPFDYPRVAKKAGYVPLAASSSAFNALFVVRGDSKIKTLEDLRGKSIATLPPIAAVTILGRLELERVGLKEDKDYWFEFTKKHDNCLQLLTIKQVDACITADYPLSQFRENVFKKLVVIHTSQNIIRPAFFVHERVAENEREAIYSIIEKWSLNYEDYHGVRNAAFRKLSEEDFDEVSKILGSLDNR